MRKNPFVSFRTWPVWLALILSGTLAFSQQSSQPPQESSAPIKVDVNVVNVLCTVRDNKGKLISNLDK